MSRRPFNADGLLAESHWQSQVFGYLRFYAWRYHHSPDNRPADIRSAGRAGRQHVGSPGFPDIIATRHLIGYGPELLIAELKADKGTYRPGQREWLRDLGAVRDLFTALMHLRFADGIPATAGAIGVYTWRPRDREEVERILAGPEGPGVLVSPDQVMHNSWTA